MTWTPSEHGPCPACGGSVDGRSDKIYCKKRCQRRARRNDPCDCGRPRTSRHMRRCPDCADVEQRKMRTARICPQCGGPVVGRLDKVYCKEVCRRKAAWVGRGADRWRASYKKNRTRRINDVRMQQATKRAFIINAKNGPCADCGMRYPYWVMEFDHVRGEKNFNMARAHQKGIATIRTELAKCDLVCANCHRQRTYGRQVKRMVLA